MVMVMVPITRPSSSMGQSGAQKLLLSAISSDLTFNWPSWFYQKKAIDMCTFVSSFSGEGAIHLEIVQIPETLRRGTPEPHLHP